MHRKKIPKYVWVLLTSATLYEESEREAVLWKPLNIRVRFQSTCVRAPNDSIWCSNVIQKYKNGVWHAWFDYFLVLLLTITRKYFRIGWAVDIEFGFGRIVCARLLPICRLSFYFSFSEKTICWNNRVNWFRDLFSLFFWLSVFSLLFLSSDWLMIIFWLTGCFHFYQNRINHKQMFVLILIQCFLCIVY